MANIKTLKDNNNVTVYPQTTTDAVFGSNGETLTALLASKETRYIPVRYTLEVSKWSGGKYSFESTYPASQYNLDIEPDGDVMTAAQYEIFSSASLVGMMNENSIRALGTVPNINLPIILTVKPK